MNANPLQSPESWENYVWMNQHEIECFYFQIFHCGFTLNSSFFTPVQLLVEYLEAGRARGHCTAENFDENIWWIMTCQFILLRKKQRMSFWYFQFLGITAALVVRAGNPFMMTVLETSSFSNRCSFLEPSPRLSMSLPEPLSRSLWFPLLSSPLDLFSPVMWFPKRITPFLIRCERIQICYNINYNRHKKQVAWLTIVMIIMSTIVWTSTTAAIMPIRSSVVGHCQCFCKTETMFYYQLLQFRPVKKYVDMATLEIPIAVTEAACCLQKGWKDSSDNQFLYIQSTVECLRFVCAFRSRHMALLSFRL